MTKKPSLRAALAGLAMLAAGSVSAQSMSSPLKEPQAVPLDFLAWINMDVGWLQRQLTGMGTMGQPTIRDDTLETNDLTTLKAANRIRAFAFLAAKGLRPPYYDLTLGTASGPLRCITQFPYSVVPRLGPMDFSVSSFPVAAADSAIVKACTVTPTKGAPYAGLDRDAFRAQYFDAYGVLKSAFAEMSSDPGFMARAVDLGFFLGTEDYSGLLRVDLR